MMELAQCDVEGGQGSLFDRALLETVQRIAQYVICFRLHPVELFD
jgi:hypothetical protein